LHLLGFFAIAVAQPLLQLLGRSPEFFVAHRASAADLVLATFLLVLAVPAVLALVVWAAGLLGRKPQQAVTAVLVAVLAAVLAMQGLKQAGAHAWPVAVSAAAVIGAAFALAYARWASVRSFATILSVSAVVVPVVFLTRPGIRRILAAPHAANHAEVRLKPGAPSPGPVVLLVLDETPLLSILDAEGSKGTRRRRVCRRIGRRSPANTAPARPWGLEEWGTVQYHQRHLLQSQLADRVVGEFVARLKETGLYERALVVVVADHGVAFQAGYTQRFVADATAAE
jgi:hypothetical protein